MLHGLADHSVELDDRRRSEAVVVLHPGQLDDVRHQGRQTGGLLPHPARESTHHLRVVGRVSHRLGEQADRAHRRLELVADVDDEVASHLVHPAGVAAVLHVEHHQLGAESAQPHGHVQTAFAQRSARQHEVGRRVAVGDRAGPAERLGDHGAQLGVQQLVCSYEAE